MLDRAWWCLLACAGCRPPEAPTLPPPHEPCIAYIDPKPNAGYTNAVRVGDTLYIAGHLPFDPDRKAPAKGDPEQQVRQVWANLRATLTAAGGSLSDIVATTTFITSRDYGAAVNAVRKELFPTKAPTSTKIVVAGLACEDCLVEINAIAILPSRSCPKPP